VSFKRRDAAALRVSRLDPNGYRAGKAGTAEDIVLDATTVY